MTKITNREKATHYLEQFNTELNTTAVFEVIRETPKGAILYCEENDVTAFAYTNLLTGTVVLASIIRVNFPEDGTKPFVLAVVESVVEYADYVA